MVTRVGKTDFAKFQMQLIIVRHHFYRTPVGSIDIAVGELRL